MNHIRGRHRADLGTNVLNQFSFQFIGVVFSGHQCNVSIDTLPFNIMRIANYCGFGHCIMQDQGTFNFGGPHSMTGNIDHVIHSTSNPIVSVFIATTTITSKIIAWIHGKIRFMKTLRIIVDTPHLTRPRTRHG